MQRTEIIGNIVKDSEQRVTPTGVDVCSFTVAVKGRKKDDESSFYRVTAWRETAKYCGKFAKKRCKIYVCGIMDKPNPYTTKNGELRCDLCMTANEVEMLTYPERTEGDNEQQEQNYEPQPQAPTEQQEIPEGFTGVEVDSDELPF